MRPRAMRCARLLRVIRNRARCLRRRNATASAIPSCASTGPAGVVRFTRRAWAKFQAPGLYSTTVTQPAFFRRYLLEQLRPLSEEFGAHIEVGVSEQEIPYPFVTEAGDEFIHGELSVAELAQHFPTPVLANVGDEVADGTWVSEDREARPLALFDALRV